MTKIVFGNPDSTTVYLPTEGSFMTKSQDAATNYRFDTGDLKLTIEGQWFDSTDIEELINFLQAAKEHLKK